MKSSASESKPFQSRSKGEIPGRARRKERLSRSKLKQAFLIDSDDELMYYVRLMKRSASEPGLRPLRSTSRKFTVTIFKLAANICPFSARVFNNAKKTYNAYIATFSRPPVNIIVSARFFYVLID